MAAHVPPPEPPRYPGEKARGGEIILQTLTRRMVFIVGLIGVVLLILVLALAR